MLIIILIAIGLLTLFSVFFRTVIFHPLKTLFYLPKDIINFIRYNLFNEMETGKLICYTALFGGGKTLSCVHYVNHLYDRYNNKKIFDIYRKKWVTQKVHIISNVDINRPFEKFTTLAQVVNVAENYANIDEENNTRTCTIVLGDEFSVQMNSRSFKTNIDPLFLNALLTCRHHHIMMVYNAQRFQHVDKLLRDVTNYVVDCQKVWRVCIQKTYDAWTMENVSDPTSLKPTGRRGWFITDKDFNSYNTLACVGNLIKSVQSGDMESETEILNRIASNEKDVGVGEYRNKVIKKLKRR